MVLFGRINITSLLGELEGAKEVHRKHIMDMKEDAKEQNGEAVSEVGIADGVVTETSKENGAKSVISITPRGSPFLLDHNALPASSSSSQEVLMISPCGGMRKRGSSTTLSLLLKSSMFRQLVEKNSDAEDGAGSVREPADARTGEAYEYHSFFQSDVPDMCDLFASGGCGNVRNAFHGEIACYDNGQRAASWNGLGSMSSLP